MARDDEETRPMRRPELEDWLNEHIYHPIARRIAAPLASAGVSANAISAAGGLMIVAAGLLYIGLPWPASVLLGFLAHASWHVLDGADGDVARITGKASPFGELIDGVCDYAGHFFLYCLLAIPLFDQIGAWVFALGWASGISRIFQANHSESRRRTYLWRAYGVPWLKQAEEAQDEGLRRPGPLARFFLPFARAYLKLASGDPVAQRIDAWMAAKRDTEARELCRRLSRRPLRLQTLLGANWRTVALGLSMAAGSPLWYFLAEVLLGNLLLAASIAAQRRCDRALAAAIGA